MEDDASIAMGLDLNLTAEGFKVLTAEDGESGLALARESDLDLIILDVMLPRLNGFEVLRTLCAERRLMPVIMLSARGAEMDKVTGLELGAEDYITKPFGLAELLARVKAVLRRDAIARGTESKLTVASLVIDPATREVRRSGGLVELTATEFDVLHCLVEAGGRVLSRDQLLAAVWPRDFDGGPNVVDTYVHDLREKIDRPPPRQLLRTVRGVGYVLGR